MLNVVSVSISVLAFQFSFVKSETSFLANDFKLNITINFNARCNLIVPRTKK